MDARYSGVLFVGKLCNVLTHLCQEYLREPNIWRELQQNIGWRRYSWQRRASNLYQAVLKYDTIGISA